MRQGDKESRTEPPRASILESETHNPNGAIPKEEPSVLGKLVHPHLVRLASKDKASKRFEDEHAQEVADGDQKQHPVGDKIKIVPA